MHGSQRFIGTRPLASCLAGGDLDGSVVIYHRLLAAFSFVDMDYRDLYDVIFYSPFLPTEHIDPASYPPGPTRENEGKRASTVDDICDFIVEYINSDVLVGAFFAACFDPASLTFS